ncbi:MAG: M3 family oligoendopeptidase [Candidatus Eisenbacteria bacterium]|nr:M3 family oligoendopeptidase [Candidatus Eisenbacteria bacterium]
MRTYDPTWNLDSLYRGGSRSPEFRSHLDACDAALDACGPSLSELPKRPGPEWARAILGLQDVGACIWDANSFVECLEAQDVSDALAGQLAGRVQTMNARRAMLLTEMESRLLAATEEEWKELLSRPDLSAIAFTLNELREIARLKMPPEKERLVEELSVDGYHAWGRMYEKIAGSRRVEFEEEGKKLALSMGQVHNRLENPDRDVRKRAFEKMESAWSEVAELAAIALNSQAGYRLSLYKNRGWESVLAEPLRINRIKRETLEAMWSAVADESARLVPYMKEKARLLGIERLAWYDLAAPVGSSDRKFTYGEAAEFILEQFGRFSEDLRDFARGALEKRWIEAEDRAGKRAGGFCTDFPLKGETRIFMTFGGSFGSVSTLGHELGHAYHSWIVKDLPFWATQYPMTLAETASTFSEMILSDAALEAASSDRERLALLRIQADDAVTMMMNLRARFLFETSFFDARRTKSLTVEELNAEMRKAEETAYRGALDPNGYHPLFWASKLHFYITGTPFYNFPYVFGYLFSNGIYARAVLEGPSFARKYAALLRETGRGTCEEVARKHLGVDLAKPEFWKSATDRAVEKADRFVALAGRV